LKMKNVMGLLNCQRKNTLIKELAEKRPIASIPFAGRYRIIDFALSSMVNSGIRNVGIILPNNSRSLLDHLRSGKDWDLARHHKGLFYLPPARGENDTEGDLKNCYFNLDFVEHSSEEYVLLADAATLYNLDFRPVYAFHQEKNADITMVFSRERHANQCDGAVLQVNEDNVVTDIAVKQSIAAGEKISLGVYLMKKNIFIEMVRYAFERGGTGFLRDAVERQAVNYKICAMEHKGYAARIRTTMSYYNASMDVLEPEIWQEMFLQKDHAIVTKVKDMAPVQYKEGAQVTDSLVANGCIIHGTVEHSILGRCVKVEPGAQVKNCVVMQNCIIGKNSLTENVICDKNVTITDEKWLKGAPTYPLIVGKDIVI